MKLVAHDGLAEAWTVAGPAPRLVLGGGEPTKLHSGFVASSDAADASGNDAAAADSRPFRHLNGGPGPELSAGPASSALPRPSSGLQRQLSNRPQTDQWSSENDLAMLNGRWQATLELARSYGRMSEDYLDMINAKFQEAFKIGQSQGLSVAEVLSITHERPVESIGMLPQGSDSGTGEWPANRGSSFDINGSTIAEATNLINESALPNGMLLRGSGRGFYDSSERGG